MGVCRGSRREGLELFGVVSGEGGGCVAESGIGAAASAAAFLF